MGPGVRGGGGRELEELGRENRDRELKRIITEIRDRELKRTTR